MELSFPTGNKRNHNNQGYNWTTIYDGLGRRVQTSYADATGTKETSEPLKLTYYYDPEVEHRQLGSCGVDLPEVSPQGRDERERTSQFLDLGHSINRTWNIYGPDRSGTYGGAQGIGGLEAEFNQNSGRSSGLVNNLFGDSLGIMMDSGFYPWGAILGCYGAMPGSSVNTDLVPQWRGHYR